ncbi:hypothetical protein [Streptomyces sp. NPDC002845]
MRGEEMDVSARVRRVAAVVVVGGVLAVAGCSPDTDTDTTGAKPSSSPVPSRALVMWADGMCQTTDGFEALKKRSAAEIKDITDPPEEAILPVGMEAQTYLSSTSSSLDSVVQALDGLGESGITAADRLHDRFAEDVGKAATEATELADYSVLHSLSEKEKIKRAERVAGLVKSLKMPKPDLRTVADDEPKLAAAYRLAPRCVPPAEPSPSTPERAEPTTPSPASTGPLPKAEDGKDTGACKDGDCEILVTEPVDFLVGDWDLHVTVKGSTVTVTHSDSSGFVSNLAFGDGGGGAFATAGGTETAVDATAVNKDGAVLKFSTK